MLTDSDMRGRALKVLGLLATIGFVLLIAMQVVSAEVFSLPTTQANKCIQLVQTCSNCTFVNVSTVSFPNQTILNLNQQMSNPTPSFYNYTFCRTQDVGYYSYSTFGNPDGQQSTASISFEVTTTGTNISTSQGILYAISFAILLPLFFLFLFGAIMVPFDNPRNSEGYIEGINYYKYAKIMLWVFSYIILMGIFYMAWNLGDVFLGANSIGNFFQFLFWFMVAWMLPIVAVSFVIIIKNLIDDAKINEGIKRGLNMQ